MSDVRVLKNKLATIPGKSILSTIDTMSALGDLGREVLRQYEIEKTLEKQNKLIEMLIKRG